MLKTLEKLRRAPYKARERVTAVITIAIVAGITVVWFIFFIFSLFSRDFSPPSSAGTASGVATSSLEAPFSE